MKKVEANTVSLKVYGAWAYSYACTAVNSRPSATVRARPWISPLRSPSRSAWCAQVTVQPEVSRISVLSKGSENGSKVMMPSGGHTLPIASLGNSEASKKAQKKAAKNITSEAMNSDMP